MNNTNLFVGLALIMIGVFFLLDIGYLWPILLILLGIFMLFRTHITAGFILLTIGGIVLYGDVANVDAFPKLWPLIVIAIGASFLLKNVIGVVHKRDGADHTSDKVTLNVFMSENQTRVKSQQFKHAQVEAFMGSAKLDLSKAKLDSNGATVNISAFAAEVEITVPDDVEVRSNGEAILASWENSFSNNFQQGGPALTIAGSVVMGEVKVRN